MFSLDMKLNRAYESRFNDHKAACYLIHGDVCFEGTHPPPTMPITQTSEKLKLVGGWLGTNSLLMISVYGTLITEPLSNPKDIYDELLYLQSI
jgi:hypothetical protein